METHITAHVHKAKSKHAGVEDYLIIDIRCNGCDIGHISTSSDVECIPFAPGWLIRAYTSRPVTGFTGTTLTVEDLYIDDERIPYDDHKMIFNAEDFL